MEEPKTPEVKKRKKRSHKKKAMAIKSASKPESKPDANDQAQYEAPYQQQPQPPPYPQAGAGNSITWKSPEQLQSNEFNRIQTSAHRLGFDKSLFFPKDVKEYVKHKDEFVTDTLASTENQLKHKIEDYEARKRGYGGEDLTINPVMEEVTAGVRQMGGGLPIGAWKKAAEMEKDTVKPIEHEAADDGEGGMSKPSERVPKPPGVSKVLGLRTDIWAGDEQNLTEGHRKHNFDKPRAAWPDTQEYKLEGDAREAAGFDRRLPRPKIDALNHRALYFKVGDVGGLTYTEAMEKIRKVTKWTPEQLETWEKQTVHFQAEMDKLSSIDKEIANDKLLEEGVNTLVLKGHGSLAAFVAAKAKAKTFTKTKKELEKKDSETSGNQTGALAGLHMLNGVYVPASMMGKPGPRGQTSSGRQPEPVGDTPAGVHMSNGVFIPASMLGRPGPPGGNFPIATNMAPPPRAVYNQSATSSMGIGAGEDRVNEYGVKEPVDMEPPPGGWQFADEHLRTKGKWGELLDEMNEVDLRKGPRK